MHLRSYLLYTFRIMQKPRHGTNFRSALEHLTLLLPNIVSFYRTVSEEKIVEVFYIWHIRKIGRIGPGGLVFLDITMVLTNLNGSGLRMLHVKCCWILFCGFGEEDFNPYLLKYQYSLNIGPTPWRPCFLRYQYYFNKLDTGWPKDGYRQILLHSTEPFQRRRLLKFSI